MYFDVLELIDRGFHKPTRIMYRANLSWSNLKNVLELLSNGRMIQTKNVGKSTRYFLTEKGKEALSFHLKSVEMLEVPIAI